MSRRTEKCPTCKGAGLITVDDWLIKGKTVEELAKEKEEALKDIVEVVRCYDCKHLQVINDGKVYAKCTMTDFEFLPFGTDTREHYCGFGERSENETR